MNGDRSPLVLHASPERERVRELVQRHGWNATAFQTLESGYHYFFADDACVAYVDTGAAWVVAGAPIAAPLAIGAVTSAFMRAARAAGKRCCFFATEQRFHEAMRGEVRSVRIGEQPVWDPRAWPEILSQRKSLREQLRRARERAVGVRQLSAEEIAAGPARAAMGQVLDRWYWTRAMAPMDFLVQVEPFTFPEQRRCFVAEQAGRVVGFAAVVPVPARSGWFIEDLVRDPRAPNGTAEALVDAVMRWAAEDNCSWLTLGLAPLSGEVAGWLRLLRRGTRFLYDFDGLRTFKAKLKPSAWSPIFLSYPVEMRELASIYDALAAFARGGFLRFAILSLLRGPTSVLRALTVLLMPWTLALALAPVRPWFGKPWAKWAWVGFDVLVFTGLYRVLRRPTTRLYTLLLCAVSADASLTVLQTLLWNVREPRTPLVDAVLALACAAPAFAALMLRGARRAHLRTR